MLLNKSRAEQIMEKHGLEGLVATSPENVAYLTGSWILTHLRHRGRQVYAVISRKDMGPDMVAPRGLADHPLQGNTWVRQLYTYGDFFFSPQRESPIDPESDNLFKTLEGSPRHKKALEALIHCLKENGLQKGKIGVDQGGDVAFIGGSLAKELPGLETIPAYDIFRQIRLIKTREEVRRIREATRVTERALEKAIQAIREGVSEKELGLIFKESVVHQGGLPTLSWIGTGPRGALPNAEPSDHKVHKGDAVRFDVGCVFQAYHADIARTVVLGPPSAKQEKYHAALLSGESRVLEAFRPGAILGELFQKGMREVREKGIPHYERHHLGHGTGIEGYDLPMITPGNPVALEPGMVLCVETPYYEPGFGGLHVEDTIEVTPDGSRLLTQLERKLFVV
jgi:Xaa-Pro dipeptidase